MYEINIIEKMCKKKKHDRDEQNNQQSIWIESKIALFKRYKNQNLTQNLNLME